MRRRIAWVVAATTSAVVLVFVIPLCLLVRSMAEDRGIASASQEARNIAILVSGLHGNPRLPDLVTAVEQRSPARTSVLTAAGQVLGAPAPGLARDPQVQRALAGEAFTVVDDTGARILVPVVTPDGTDVVRTTVSMQVLHQGVRRAWLGIGALGFGLFVAAVLIADRLGRRVSTPVTDVAAVAHRLREGDLGARAVPSGPPETAELAEALNRLADRITELLAAERAAVGDLSHRLRTPVTALRLDAESVADGDVAERLQQHIGHLQRTIDAIVKEARRPVRHDMQSECDATEVVRERIAFWSALADDQARMLEVALPNRPEPVAVDASDLRDILDVLVDNVFAHTPEGTPLSIALHREEHGLVLTVADRGPGLQTDPPEQSDRPGFTGLGLQIVRRTVTGFGGAVRTESAGGEGTRVLVTLPPAGPAPRPLRHGQSSSRS
jgi:signal transduction histidine kinase